MILMSNNTPYFKVKKGKYSELNLTNAPMDEDTLYVCKEGKLFYDYSNDSSTGRIQIGEEVDNTNTKISTTNTQPISVGKGQINKDSINCGENSIYVTLPINSIKVYANSYGPSGAPFYNLYNTDFVEIKGQFKEVLPNNYPSPIPSPSDEYHSVKPAEWLDIANDLGFMEKYCVPEHSVGWMSNSQIDIPAILEMTGDEGSYSRPGFSDTNVSYTSITPKDLASVGPVRVGGIITINNLYNSQKFLIFAIKYSIEDTFRYQTVPGEHLPHTEVYYQDTEFNFSFFAKPIGYKACNSLEYMLGKSNTFSEVTTSSDFNPRANKYYEIISGGYYTPSKETTRITGKNYYTCCLNVETAKKDSNDNNLTTYKITPTENNIINLVLSTCVTNDYNLNIGNNCNLGRRSATIGNQLSNFNAHSLTLGSYNRFNDDYIFSIGNGSTAQQRNCFGITYNGKVYTSYPISTSGADYAEYFEWETIPSVEDCRGLFVTLNKNKIKLATKNDKYILGVISAKPTVLGNSMEEEWKGTYQTDIFGDYLYDDIENTLILSKDYDKSKKYIPRSKRKEWAIVGLMGQIIVVDDGTCEEGGFCYPGENGIATAAEKGYYVMERLDDNHIKVLFK